eukprot:1808814-Amphidinium_carterae.1
MLQLARYLASLKTRRDASKLARESHLVPAVVDKGVSFATDAVERVVESSSPATSSDGGSR